MLEESRTKEKKKRGRPSKDEKVDLAVIYESALVEFANKGFDGARLSSIAKGAGVANSLLTYHFNKKDDLWRRSVEHLISKLLARFTEVRGYFKDLEGVAAFKAYTRQFIYFSAEYPEFYKIVFHEMCTQTERASWLVQHILRPAHELYEGEELKGTLNFMGYSVANLSSIIIGASNVFFIHSFQMKEMYGVDPFAKEEIEKHADIVIDLLFAKFEETHNARH